MPTQRPTARPTYAPSYQPTAIPTRRPTSRPTETIGTRAPTPSPTKAVTQKDMWLDQRMETELFLTNKYDWGTSTKRYGAITAAGCQEWKIFRSTVAQELKSGLSVISEATLVRQRELGTPEDSAKIYRACEEVVEAVSHAFMYSSSAAAINCEGENDESGAEWNVFTCGKEVAVCIGCDPKKVCEGGSKGGSDGESSDIIGPCIEAPTMNDVYGVYIFGVMVTSRVLAPIPTSITLLSTADDALKLKVTVTVSTTNTGAYVYCAAYDAAVRVEASKVAAEGVFATFDDLGEAVVNVIGLEPSTKYIAYCATKSIDGSGVLLSTTSMLASGSIEGTTSGTKTAAVSLLTPNVFVSVESRSDVFMTIGLPQAPDFVTMTPKLHLNGTEVRGVVFPPSYVVYDAIWNTDKLFEFRLDSHELSDLGNYDVTVVFTNMDGNLVPYQTKLNGGRAATITVSEVNDPLPAPIISDARFSIDGSYLEVQFSCDTDRRLNIGSRFWCDEMFVTSHEDGLPRAQCVWITDSHIDILTSSLPLLEAGIHTIGLREGVEIRAKKPDTLSADGHMSWPSASTADVTTIQAPTRPVIPVVKTSGPSRVSTCDSFEIDFSSSTGSCGREWSSVAVTVTSTSSSATVEHLKSNIYSKLSEGKIGDSLSIKLDSDGLMEDESSYSFVITLCNFLQGCKSSEHSIYVYDASLGVLPMVQIMGPSNREVSRSTDLVVTVEGYISVCGGARDASSQDLTFGWSLYDRLGTLVPVESSSVNPRIFKLNAYTLEPLEVYKLRATVVNRASTNGTAASSSDISISVAQGLLKPIIKNDGSLQDEVQDVQIRPNGTIALHARNTYDMDFPSLTLADDSLEFTWSCTQLTPSFSDECSFDLQESELGLDVVLAYNTSISPDSTSLLKLLVSDGKRSAEASVLVRAVDGSAATIALTSSNGASKHISSSRLIVTAKVDFDPSSVRSGTLEWNLFPPVEGVVAPYVVVERSVSLSRQLSFVLPANSPVEAGVAYRFSLKCRMLSGKESSSFVDVFINAPPTPGQFDVSPVYGGIELNTSYAFSTKFWTDDDGDTLGYAFGYKTEKGTVMITRHQLLFGSSAKLLLPLFAYDTITGHGRVTCVAYIYDSLGANATSLFEVYPKPISSLSEAEGSGSGSGADGSIVKLTTLQSFLDSKTKDAEEQGLSDLDGFRNVLVSVAASLDIVNCTLPTSVIDVGGCAGLRRSECMGTDRTCGPCLYADYIGQSGDSNSPCIDPATLTQNDTIRSTFPEKRCPSDCNGNGDCLVVLKDDADDDKFSSIEDTCTIDDFKCERVCVCRSGWVGRACLYTDAELDQRRDLKQNILKSFVNITALEDESMETFVEQVGVMVSLTGDADDLTEDSSMTVLTSLSRVLDGTIEKNFEASTLLPMARAVVESTMTSYLSDIRLQKRGSRRLYSGSDPVARSTRASLTKLDDINLRDFVEGQVADDVILSTFRSGSIAISDDNSPTAVLTTPRSSAEAAAGVMPGATITISSRGAPLVVVRSTDKNLYDDLEPFAGDDASILSPSVISITSTVDVGSCYENTQTKLPSGHLAEVVIQHGKNPYRSSFEPPPVYYVSCTKDVKESGEVPCPEGPLSVQCDGKDNGIRNVTCPTSTATTSCGDIAAMYAVETGNGVGDILQPCVLKSTTALNTTCECDLCLAEYIVRQGYVKHRRRRLFSRSSAEDVGIIEIAAMTEFVYTDAIDVLVRSQNVEQTLEDAWFIAASFGVLWLGMLALVVLSEFGFFHMSPFWRSRLSVSPVSEEDMSVRKCANAKVAPVEEDGLVRLEAGNLAKISRFPDKPSDNEKLDETSSSSSASLVSGEIRGATSTTSFEKTIGIRRRNGIMLTESDNHSSIGATVLSHLRAMLSHVDEMDNIEIFHTSAQTGEMYTDAQKREMMEYFIRMKSFVEGFFVGTFSSLPRYERLANELKKHGMMRVISTSVPLYERLINCLEVLTNISVSAVTLALLFDLQFPRDDKRCGRMTSEEDCNAVKTPMDGNEPLCSWRAAGSSTVDSDPKPLTDLCLWVEPEMTLTSLLLLLIVVIIVTGPLYILVDFIFTNVLTAPSSEDIEMSVRSSFSGMKSSMKMARSNALQSTNESNRSICSDYVMSDALLIAIEESEARNDALHAELASGNSRHRIVHIADRSSNRYALGRGDSGAVTKLGTTRAQARLRKLRKLFHNNRKLAIAMFKGESSECRHVQLFDWTDKDFKSLTNISIPTWVLRGEPLNTTFMREYSLVCTQLEHDVVKFRKTLLHSAERAEFDRQWGIHANVLDRTLRWRSPAKIAYRVAEAVAISQRQIRELELKANSASIGLDLVFMFCADMLGRSTAQAKTFLGKTAFTHPTKYMFSKWFKGVVLLFALSLNFLFIWLCVSMSSAKGEKWQREFLVAAIMKIGIDIMLVKLLQLIVVQFYVPEYIRKEVCRIKCILLEACAQLIRPDHVYDLNSFSCTDYMHASTMVAKIVPDLLESKMILQYRSPLPEDLGIDPPSQRIRWKSMSVIDIVSTMAVTAVLNFGALHLAIKNVIIHTIPTSFIITCTFFVVALSSVHSVLGVFGIVVFVAVALYMLYSLMKPIFDDGRKLRWFEGVTPSLEQARKQLSTRMLSVHNDNHRIWKMTTKSSSGDIHQPLSAEPETPLLEHQQARESNGGVKTQGHSHDDDDDGGDGGDDDDHKESSPIEVASNCDGGKEVGDGGDVDELISSATAKTKSRKKVKRKKNVKIVGEGEEEQEHEDEHGQEKKAMRN